MQIVNDLPVQLQVSDPVLPLQNGFSGDMLDVMEHDLMDLAHVNYLLDYLSNKKMQLEGVSILF